MTTHRSEKDSMGAIEVPADQTLGRPDPALAGAFPHLDRKMPGELIYALALTKRARRRLTRISDC